MVASLGTVTFQLRFSVGNTENTVKESCNCRDKLYLHVTSKKYAQQGCINLEFKH